jgi:hypothetical protein
MEKILEVQKEYNRLKFMCSNNKEAIKEALFTTFKGLHEPHIYLDVYEDFSYITINGYVMFDSGEIYSKV